MNYKYTKLFEMYNQNLRISPLGIQLLQGYEKCILTAYNDNPGNPEKGTWTIGWGSTRYEDGSRVKEGDTITQELADKLFAATLPKFEDKVREKVQRDLKQYEFDAAMCFCYNAGTSYNSHGQWRDYNIWNNITNRLEGIAMETYWCNLAITQGGLIVHGLQRRRKSEVTMYLTGELNFFE